MRLHHAAGTFGDQCFQINAVDQIQRINDVALGLGHFVAVLVADQAGDVHLFEWHFAGEFQAHHDHSGNPEENDVEAGDQYIGWIEGLECRSLFRPAQCRERPQGR